MTNPYVDRQSSPEPAEKTCRYCGATAPHATLVAYGARCLRCYAHFLTEPQRWPEAPHYPGPRGWIERLRYRRDVLGEPLSAAQVDAMQRAEPVRFEGEAEAEA